MNKIMALVNIDLKRSKKFYLTFIGLFFSSTILINIIQILRYRKRTHIIEKAIETFDGIFYGNAILFVNGLLSRMFTIGVLSLIVYSIYSWVREYTQSSKSFYTLLMIPANRYYLFLAKIISTVTMIYGYILSLVIALFISKFFFNILLRKFHIIKTSFANDILSIDHGQFSSWSMSNVIPSNFLDFIMTYGFLLIAVLSVLFCGLLTILSYKDSIVKLLGILVLCVFVGYIMIYSDIIENMFVVISSKTGSLGFCILFYTLGVCMINFISYYLINKKLYV